MVQLDDQNSNESISIITVLEQEIKIPQEEIYSDLLKIDERCIEYIYLLHVL